MRQGIVGILVVVVLAFLGAISCSNAQELQADTVERALAERGAQATLSAYFNCEKYQGSAYEKIATGARPWVALAEKVISQSDACYTEGIQAALGEAMRKAPQHVLGLVGKTERLGAEYICLPFISDEQPIAGQLEEIEKSRQAIALVQSSRLAPQKAACLRFIDDTEQRVRAQAPMEPAR